MTKTKLIESTGRKLYVTDELLESSPEKVEGSFELFTIGKYVTASELQAEYDKRGLLPADIETMTEHDKEFDEKKYVATQWKDKDGNWCYASFDRNGGERRLGVYQNDRGWYVFWWFAGVRKSSEISHSDLSPQTLDTLGAAIQTVINAGYTVECGTCGAKK